MTIDVAAAATTEAEAEEARDMKDCATADVANSNALIGVDVFMAVDVAKT